MTPDGEIFHVATGYQSPDDLLDESRFALELFNRMRSETKRDQAKLVVNSHQKRIKNPPSNGRAPLSEFEGLMSKFMPAGMNARDNRFPVQNMMGQFTQMGVNRDQQFSVDFPLLTYQELEREPSRLVGSGDSFFASSSGGTNLFSK